MNILEKARALHADLSQWRRHLHSNPELGFEEQQTADLVADKLTEFGLETDRGMATTGVVGTLNSGTSKRAIGLRADMDALPMPEKNTFDYRSRHDGRMHACGHDGHTTMLLGAARLLSQQSDFDGTVQFIFQPAEEGGGGGDVMVREGLFDRFPVEAVYGMHNWPGLKQGAFAIRPGPIMASADFFEFTVNGTGGHAAMPHLGFDPFVATSHLLSALQAIPSRRFDATDSAVISVTQVHGGSAWNVIPDHVTVRGTVRTLRASVREAIEPILRDTAEGIAKSTHTEISLDYYRGFPVTDNHAEQTEIAAHAAAELVGRENVQRELPPSMGAEDFAYMLNALPGAYIWIGNGENSPSLHSSSYDFNDDILPVGAAYWTCLTRGILAAGGGRP